LNGIDFSDSKVRLTYFGNIQVSSVSPVLGSSLGGSIVIIEGAGFSSLDDLRCRFGSIYSLVQVVSETTVSCKAPGVSPSVSVVDLYLESEDFELFVSKFSYFENPYLESLLPVRGPTTGGWNVKFRFSDLPRVRTLACRFGYTLVTSANFRSSVITCVAPKLPLGDIVVEFSVNGFDFFEVGTIEIIPSINLLSITPQSGSSLGGQLIYAGAYFYPGEMVCCAFDNQVMAAKSITNSTVLCNTPKHSSGNVSFVLHYCDSIVSNYSDLKILNFEYIEAYTVDSIFPLSSLENLNSSIVIKGRDFSNILSYICRFELGSHVVDFPVSYIDTKTLMCHIPAYSLTGSQKFNLFCSTTMQNMYSTMFDFIDPPIFFNIFPNAGYEEGGTKISIKSASLRGFWEVGCRFGDYATKAYVSYDYNSSDWNIVCNSPPSKPGTVPVFITPNNVDYIYTGLNFTYYPLPIVDSIYPTRLVNKTSYVSIVGSNLHIASKVCCKFGSQSRVRGVVVSESEVQCELPDLWKKMKHTFTSSLQIASNCVDFVETGQSITVVASPQNVQFSPVLGYFTGGTSVIFTSDGLGKNSPGLIVCLFGSIKTPAYVVDVNRTVCTSPPINPMVSNIIYIIVSLKSLICFLPLQ
jgi:hypothetical protein